MENVENGVWLDANRYYDAERRFYEVSLSEQTRRANPGNSPDGMSQMASSLASEIANARQKIHNFLKTPVSAVDCHSRVEQIEIEQRRQYQALLSLKAQMKEANAELKKLKEELKMFTEQRKPKMKELGVCDDSEATQNGSTVAADDDDIDLFGSDEENEDEKKLKEERIKAYADKKSKKPALIAKSSIVLDIKPWDDETDMKVMEKAVKRIATDGLVWGASKVVPLVYGIFKLQIVAIVEDEKVSVQWLQETIEEMKELVQSVDIAAFNKL